MARKLTRTVVMVGMMGSGKTAIGTALARRLAVPFLDSDHEIELAADRTVAEIFSRDGEAFFRAKETQVIERLLEGPCGVLSTGGGAFLKEENREIIARKGVSLCLKADVDLLWSRVAHKTTRPLLLTDNPFETLKSIYAERAAIYEMAQIVVPVSAIYSIEETTGRVEQALIDHGILV